MTPEIKKMCKFITSNYITQNYQWNFLSGRNYLDLSLSRIHLTFFIYQGAIFLRRFTVQVLLNLSFMEKISLWNSLLQKKNLYSMSRICNLRMVLTISRHFHGFNKPPLNDLQLVISKLHITENTLSSQNDHRRSSVVEIIKNKK